MPADASLGRSATDGDGAIEHVLEARRPVVSGERDMTNFWKLTTAILAVLLVASVALAATGLNPFANVAQRSNSTSSQAGDSKLIPLKVAIAGAGSPGSSAPEFGVAMGLGAFEAQGLDVKWVSMQPTTNLLIAALMTN